MQFLYSDGEFWHFMHQESFEQHQADKAAAVAGDAKVRMLALTGLALEQAGVQLDHPAWHVRFDSEEACQQSHGGDWTRRLMGR